MKLRFLSLLAFAFFLCGRAQAQIPFDDCGFMIQGVTCPLLFEDSNGHDWILDNNGGFQLGDNVHVVGTATPGCISICQQGSGCIAVANITLCGSGPSTGTSFCAGDGSGTACPCGNNSPSGQGRGCVSSLGNGALLGATGTASVSNDNVVLQGAGMPDSSALYFQGTAQTGGGAGAVFGDGLRCAGGTVVRLGTKTNSGGMSQFPAAGDPALSIKGGVTAGDTRTYQVWYRNAAAFCTTSTFNLTNGYQIVWTT
jgi:hypothetical protein